MEGNTSGRASRPATDAYLQSAQCLHGPVYTYSRLPLRGVYACGVLHKSMNFVQMTVDVEIGKDVEIR